MMEKSLWSVRAEIARPKALTVLVAAALAAVYAGVPASAWADGGRGSTITTNQPGGAGGIDGDAASATGKMGNSLNNPLGSAGGGGGVNLTTGAGAAGGARGIGSTGTQTAGGTAGATGTTAATYSTAQTVNSNFTGGNGGAGSANNAATTLGGGGGGGVGISTTADLVIAAGTITGGRGYTTMYVGSGGGGVGIFSSAHVTVQAGGRVVGGAGGGTAALGGAGGGGGMGVLLTAGGSVDNYGTIIGGDGGTASTTGFTGGGAGDGGAGVQLTAAGTVFNAGAITGGVGGKGPGNFMGSPGGAGVRFSAGGSLLNTGTITGGAGGGAVTLGKGATGGAGVLFSAGGTVVNQGTISGGAGGSSVSGTGGPGGVGISGSDVTIINAGLIRGAVSGTPGTSTQAAAIQFTGGINVLEIQAGSALSGKALAYSSADTLRLGGDTDSSFDVSTLGAAASAAQYQGFGVYEKNGASTWTLTGTTAAGTVTAWTVSGGALSISDDASLGAATGTLTLDGGTLQNTAAITASRAIVLNTAGGTFQTDADYTSTGIISGDGGLTKTGAATLTLSGANTYTGGTTITAGTVAISANENLGAAQSSIVLNGGTLQTTTAMSISRDIVLGAAGGTLRTDADLSNGGEISGVGGLTKAGVGTLTLTGPITYLGTTTIQEGTLLTPAVNLGSNDITNNGTLALQQDSAGQLDGAINGTGNLVKLGAGRLNLTGGGDLSGTTYVQAGTLSINGSLANSAVEVDAGGTLGGNGTVGAITVRGGGSVAPGNSVGTLRVNGNFVQEAGSTYVVEFDNASSDQIAVTGTATVQPGAGLTAVSTDTSGSLLKAGTKYTVLSTTGGLTGTYVLNQTPLTAFLGVRDSYDANNAYLTVVQVRDPAEAATTPNQEATAGGSAGSVVSDVVLNSPTDDAARNTLDQLSGAALASAKGAMVYDSRYSRDLAIDRLRNAFCTVGADDARGGNSDRRLGTCGAGDAAGRVAWGQTWGGWGHTNGNGNAGGIDRDSAGFVVGMDVPVGSWRVGGLTGYSHGRYKVDDQNARTESDDFHLGVYGGTQWGALALRLGGVYTFHDVNSGRDVNVAAIGGRMKADYQANTTQAFGELGYQLKAGPVALEPFVNLAYVNLHTNAFNERGGEAALSSRSTDTSTSFSTLGLRASSDLQLGKVDATVRGLLGWRRAYGDVTPKSRVSFNGGDTFTVSGVPIGKDAAVIGAGLDLHITPRVTAGVAFDGQFGSGASDRTVSGTVRVVF